MKDITVTEFCDKFVACQEGRDWAVGKGDMMSQVWEHLTCENHLLWVATQEGVFTDLQLRKMAVRSVREAPGVLALLTDQRSLDALDVADRFADGLATVEELDAASAAARDAARDASAAARDASAAASAAAWDASAAASAAAWVAARDASAAAWVAARDAAWVAARDASAAQTSIIKSFGNPFEVDNA